MQYGIQLKTRVTLLQPEGNHRFQAWVSEHVNIAPEIFVYQRCPNLPEEPLPDDRFVNVASVADMAEYPATTPVGTVPFFRLSAIDLVFRSVHALDETWEAIREDIRDLLENKYKLDELGTDATWDFNEGVLHSSSSSSAMSQTSSTSQSSESSTSSQTSTP